MRPSDHVQVLTRQDRGSALLPVLLLMFLFTAIALGAAVVVRMEVVVAERYRQATEALHAAEAAIDVVTAELRGMPAWTMVLSGARRSGYASGPFSGSRGVPGGGTIALCCGPGSVSARLNAETALSPLPARRAIAWQPFLWTAFDTLVPKDPPSRLFVIAFVGNDEAEMGAEDENDMLLVRAEAIDPSGARRTIEAMLARRPAGESEPEGPGPGPVRPPGPPIVGILQWHEVR